MYDLPSEDPEEPGLPDEFHYYQPQLLRETFCLTAYPPEQICVATDLNLYYDPQHTTWYKRPDWFAVLGVPRFYEGHELRYSYVIWQERVIPFIVVELLSEGTEAEDLGQTVRDVKQPPTKWQVYEQILQIPYYLIFSRTANELRVFQWQAGRYHVLTLNEGKVWLPEIQLGIGLWYGAYQGLERHWLRWYDAQHHWIPTPLEQLEQEHHRAEQEHYRAERERQRAEHLAAQLRALGIEPQ
ncbi:MAG: Uma2 family endonuclease [Thioploca sp.]|nr:Uma2 family endonuclease [Thioploca sp.]